MNRDEMVEFRLPVASTSEPRMTEAEWHTNEFPGRLLEYSKRITALTWAARRRKYRLAATAIVRAFLWSGSQDTNSQDRILEILDEAEHVWEGQGSLDELEMKVLAADLPSGVGVRPEWGRILNELVNLDPVVAARGVVGQTQFGREGSGAGFAPTQCGILRDIFGNPFRPVIFEPAWRTDTVVSLAKHMYESRDFSAMPILADALQDAGCDNEDVLNHCRDEKNTHVRGCWVVDLALGKS